ASLAGSTVRCASTAQRESLCDGPYRRFCHQCSAVQNGFVSGSKHWSGETCPKTGTYGQHDDKDDSYAGAKHDRQVDKGETFPPSLNNHHFEEK
ncbi:hypothetical protein GHU41_29500, partial [Pseudomonas aeruginosa]|nr:hypothetical protein [Pseudomonas aeruginosa]